jgi:hypothetical protein
VPGTLNGLGTGFVGKRDVQPDGSYITTEWAAVVLPLFPLRSYRVRSTGRLYLGFYNREDFLVTRVPLCWRQVANTYAVLLGIPLLAALIVPFLMSRLSVLLLVLLGALSAVLVLLTAQASKGDSIPLKIAKFVGMLSSIVPVVGLILYLATRGRPSGYGERCGGMALMGLASYLVWTGLSQL